LFCPVRPFSWSSSCASYTLWGIAFFGFYGRNRCRVPYFDQYWSKPRRPAINLRW
jgi:hypothetical protein